MRATPITAARGASSAVFAAPRASKTASARRASGAALLGSSSSRTSSAIVGRRSSSKSILPAPRALDIDWSDPDTIVGALGGVLGIVVGIGAPLFYISRDKKDEERLEELRALNRKTFEETGEYMTEEEIRAFRQPRWTDRREFQDDD